MIDFVHIHTHSSIGSMKDSLVSVAELFNKAKELNQKAIAITDHGHLTALFDAYKEYKKTGVKFIAGIEQYFVHTHNTIDGKKYERSKHLILLAQNEVGYKNLLKLNFEGFKTNIVLMGKVYSRISWDILEKYNEGLIATSACANGPIAVAIRNNNYDEAERMALRFLKIFGDRFYLEIHPHHLKEKDIDQKVINETLINISRKFGIPLVVAVDVHYLTKNHEKYHDVLLAINSKEPVDAPDRYKYSIDEFYFKTGEEVYNFLEKYYGKEVAEEAINNTINIANRCSPPDYMEVKGNHLPVFPVKDEPDYQEFLDWKKKAKLDKLREDSAFMRYKVFKGFNEKFSGLPKEEIDIRKERIKKEIKILEKNNFSSYMLVVSDFIKWAKNNNISTGIGRGSVGSSIVAYLLDIHGIDPIKYGLIFERFQNEEKKDFPDIDTDFASSGRDLVKEYCRKKYGLENYAQVSNINTYTPKNVIPDLVKSLRNVMPNLVPERENYVKISEAIKDAIPDENEEGGVVRSIKEALYLSPKLREFANRCPELMEYAQQLVELPKEFSTHAAAGALSDKPLIEFVPLRIDKNGDIAVQYEKNRCEASGLVKMDFLALSALDIIDETFRNMKKLGINYPAKMEDIPLDDVETYDMIQAGHTRCVFQLGQSAMMVALCQQIKPKNIMDIAIINALGRPSSSKEEREEFIYRRFGNKKVEYLHPSLENSLKDTYGLCIFEEQLMAVAKDMANWSLSKSDGLRKLTKLKGKDPKLAKKLEEDFIIGIIETHNTNREFAENIWKKIVLPFAGYGFNLSHAVLYSINSYYTAYLKRHFPAAYMCAYLKIESYGGGVTKDEKISIAKNECRRLGIKFVPPDINKSSSGYELLDENTIVMGLSAIKGLGEKGIEEISKTQPFNSFTDFLLKTDGRIINKSRMEALSKAGCFDSFNMCRKDICENAKKLRDKFNAWTKTKDGYEIDKFDLKLPNQEWSVQEKLKYEKEVLGELISGSLKDIYPGFFTGSAMPISKIKELPDRQEIGMELLVKDLLRKFQIKKEGRYKGKTMMKYNCEDLNGDSIELTIWPDAVKKFEEYIGKGNVPVKCICQVSKFNNTSGIMLRELLRVYGKHLT